MTTSKPPENGPKEFVPGTLGTVRTHFRVDPFKAPQVLFHTGFRLQLSPCPQQEVSS